MAAGYAARSPSRAARESWSVSTGPINISSPSVRTGSPWPMFGPRCRISTAGTTTSAVIRRSATPRLGLHSPHRRTLATPLEVKPGALPPPAEGWDDHPRNHGCLRTPVRCPARRRTEDQSSSTSDPWATGPNETNTRTQPGPEVPAAPRRGAALPTRRRCSL